jgi:transcriptional regulator with XRE-family HTH domain
MRKESELVGVGDLISARLKERGLQANEVARRANIHETTLSAVRKGRRKVSRKMAESIAKALSESPQEEERDVNEFLVAAGFAPRKLSKSRPVVIELLNQQALLDIEMSMQAGQHVWIFSRGLIETFQESFFSVVCKNLSKGVSYTYFFHYSNALDWVKLLDKLRAYSLPSGLLRGFVLPDESFRSKDVNLFECIYDAESKELFRVFRTSREVKGEYLYREENRQEAIEIRDYLTEIKQAATGNDETPCAVESHLKKTYGPDVATRLMNGSSRKNGR